ncbi:MAG: cytochrome d ubiquinol oxidase subunit II [Muribaculaceae bacterium]|nr:cytochrome d ubiquinol oxidase subunit II [Muribaculaceae bacterium]
MIQYEYLQIYWWLLISVLGAILVFLLFVQGGQTLLWQAKSDMEKTMLVNSLGRKWELTFTTLVVFGGAFFASFPLFYSTSFGGAYWLWIFILFSFVIQAVSYEFRRKPGNVFGTKTFDCFLFINGIVGCVLLGVAVATFFFGGEFTVEKQRLLDPNSPVISTWTSTRGLEAMISWKNLLLGFTVLFLARTQASLYFINNINYEPQLKAQKKSLIINGAIFVVFFLTFVAILLTSDGYQLITKDGISTIPNSFEVIHYKYLINFITLWWALIVFLLGVILVLYAIIRTILSDTFRRGIWFSGIGTILVVLALFWVAGYNGTPYYPSLIDPSSSLTIYNSSSSEFTLTTMSIVSLIIPFVVGYIAYVWYSMDKKSITPDEMNNTTHKY